MMGRSWETFRHDSGHLQPLLSHAWDLRNFIRAGEQLSRARVTRSIRKAIRLERLTSLQKPNGLVRGIVAGDIVRVARTMSQQLMFEVQDATAPFQYALATKSGCESIAALQGLTELNPRTTVISIDGISAYDLYFASSHVGRCITHCEGIDIAIRVHVPRAAFKLFVGGWCRQSAHHLAGRRWKTGRRNDAAVVLVGTTPSVAEGPVPVVRKRVFDEFLDDINMVTMLERACEVHALWSRRRCGPRLEFGCIKAKCKCETRRERNLQDATGKGHEGSGHAIHTEFIKAQLEMFNAEHQTLFDRIPWSIAQWRERTV